MKKIVYGDLIGMGRRGDFDVIVHGANCQKKMGKGFALQVAKNFPEAFHADLARTDSAQDRLGDISFAKCSTPVASVYVVNAYTQLRYGRQGVFVDIDAVCSSMTKVQQEFSGMRIAYPMIGSGLAGGDWSVIEKIIDQALLRENHTLVMLPLQQAF